jgi:multisubunit Na+/H+ antiporter MnhE subunit
MVKTIGYILFLISCLSFLMILIVPWLGFSKIQIAGITTGLIITGEILFYLSLFILGRSFYDKIKSKLKFRKAKPIDTDLHRQSDQNNIPVE